MTTFESGEVVQDWIQRSRSDLRLGRAAIRTFGVMPEAACFQAQQCAEKALKRLLTCLGLEFPRTIDLKLLFDLLKLQGLEIPSEVGAAAELSQYAVQFIYPGRREPVTYHQAKHALEQAVVVLDWAVSHVPGLAELETQPQAPDN